MLCEVEKGVSGHLSFPLSKSVPLHWLEYLILCRYLELLPKTSILIWLALLFYQLPFAPRYVVVFIYLFVYWLCLVAYGILVPQPRIKPVPPALEARSLNHWTAREVPVVFSSANIWRPSVQRTV